MKIFVGLIIVGAFSVFAFPGFANGPANTGRDELPGVSIEAFSSPRGYAYRIVDKVNGVVCFVRDGVSCVKVDNPKTAEDYED